MTEFSDMNGLYISFASDVDKLTYDLRRICRMNVAFFIISRCRNFKVFSVCVCVLCVCLLIFAPALCLTVRNPFIHFIKQQTKYNRHPDRESLGVRWTGADDDVDHKQWNIVIRFVWEWRIVHTHLYVSVCCNSTSLSWSAYFYYDSAAHKHASRIQFYVLMFQASTV